MSNPDYDKAKYTMDEYGNLIPKDGFPKDCGNLIPREKKKEELKDANKQLKEQLLLSESQNYCKICGHTLDGYKSNA